MDSLTSPLDPSLSLRRPLGYWADQLIRWSPGQGRCTCNNVTHITTKDAGHNIDLDNFKKAVLATIYNEPHLRADVDLSASPAVWVPASKFEEVFSYRDLAEEGVEGIEGAWHLVEEEVNTPWKFGSSAPLYRCVLLKVMSGYIVMNIYHHAAADGTSGMLVMGGILDQYRRLQEGGEVVKNPHKVREAMEDLVRMEGAEEIVQEMIKEKAERAKNYNPFLPFDLKEMEENSSSGLAVNKTLYRDGTKENYSAVREKCREMGVTVGALALASSYIAMAAIHAKATCSDTDKYTGMEGQYIDIPVNIRRRLDPPIGDNYCGFYITEVTTKCDVTLDTSVWELARNIKVQLGDMMGEDQHLLFSRAKEEWELGETSELAGSVPVEKTLDMLVSNKRFFMFPTDLGWGKVRALYSAGALWCPGFSNYLFLIQATDMFTYNMVHCPGPNNTQTANDLLDMIVTIMEGAADLSETSTLSDILATSTK